MKNIFIISLLAIAMMAASHGAYAQKIYSCNSRYDADIKIFVVDSRYDADLLVYKVDSRYDTDGNQGRWFFVDSRYDAGWRNKEKIHLLY